MSNITREVRYAPCGGCKTTIPRDDMHSMNVKFYDPEDSKEVKVSVRLCGECREEWVLKVSPLRWSNDQMTTRVETVELPEPILRSA